MSHLQYSARLDGHTALPSQKSDTGALQRKDKSDKREVVLETPHHRNTLEVLETLRYTKELTQVKECLLQIKESFKNETVKQYFINQNVHLLVLKTFQSHLENDLRRVCCELLDIFMEERGTMYEDIIKQTELYRYLLSFMNDNIDNTDIQLCGMKILTRLIQNDNIQNQMILDEKISDMVDLLTAVMTSSADCTEIQLYTLTGLYDVMVIAPDIQEEFIQCHFNIIMKILNEHASDPDVMLCILRIFEITSHNDKSRKLFVSDSVHKVVLKELSSNKDNMEFVITCCILLVTLCSEEEVRKELVGCEFIENILIPLLLDAADDRMLIQTIDDKVLQSTMLKLFYMLAHPTFEKEVSPATIKNACNVIYKAMHRYIDDPDIQVSGCHGISVLLECRPEAHQWIGENTNNEIHEVPLHTACLGSMLVCFHDVKVYSAVCEAFYWLAADNDRICMNLMGKNAHIAVIDGMKHHFKDRHAVQSACRAIRGICIFHEKHKHAVVAEGGLSVLTSIQIKYVDDEAVQSELISTLACLADIDIVRYQCFVESVHVKILNCMKKFISNELLQEAALECLCVLSGAEDGTSFLNEAGTFMQIIEVLDQHQNCIYIQKKGLMLIQLLAEPSVCKDAAVCKGLAKVLANAVNDHYHDDSLLKEACVLVQIYAEMGKEMSEHFVQEGCHDLLFAIMEHHADDTDLQDIASECLSLLSLEHDLKSKMLLSACANGILAGVDCLLEIGADVNFGSGEDTPLCHAVRCQNENLVKLLLKQGVIDSHLHTALMESLKNSNHQITGLLLASITKSSDRDATHIIWSGLQLPDVRPEWFVGENSDHTVKQGSDTGRYITKKIKESHHRRRSTSSLHYSESDSTLVKLRQRKQFRFQNQRKHNSDIRGDKLSRHAVQINILEFANDSNNLGGDTLGIPRLLPQYRQDNFLVPDLMPQDSRVSQGTSGLRSPYNQSKMPEFLPQDSTVSQGTSNLRPQNIGFSSSLRPQDGHASPTKGRGRRSSFPGNLSPISSPVGSLDNTSILEDNMSISDERAKFFMSESISQYSATLESSFTDHEEWKTTTLTGANIPYSPSDPRFKRRSSSPETLTTVTPQGIWMRKSSRSPSPKLMNTVAETCFFGEGFQKKVQLQNYHSDTDTDLPGKPKKTKKRWYSSPAQIEDNNMANTESVIYSQLELESRDISPTDTVAFCRLPQLESCRLSTSESFLSDTDSPRSSGKQQDVELTLDLSYNCIVSLSLLVNPDIAPTMVNILSSLVKLYINDNRIETIPDKIFEHLKVLQTLDLKVNKLSVFPSAALKHCPLTLLDLSDNKISVVDFTCENTTLEDLNLSSNHLTEWPENLSKCLPNLASLYLNRNEISSLPEESLGLKSLKKLCVSHNRIHHIPEPFLQDCRELDTLEAANNALEFLPSEKLSPLFQRLNRVKLKQNHLTEKEPFYVPKFLLELQNLRVIDLSENELNGIPPPSMWKTQMLKELHASKNNISKLNLEGATAWSKLESLHLSHNSLHELPKEVGALKSLTSLDVSHNGQLTTLPDELGNCSEMWELPLYGLDLDLDRALVKGNVKDLIAFLHNKHTHAIEYYRLKMMVVGFGGRGKTTLLQALMKKYKTKNTNTATVGVIVKTWKFERYRPDLRKTVTYTISTWDFAGQEEFYSTHQCYLSNRALYLFNGRPDHDLRNMMTYISTCDFAGQGEFYSTHQCYLSNRALYLVVYDLRKGPREMELLKPWLANINARAPGCPVIIVGTHLDCISEDKKERSYRKIQDKLGELDSSYSGFPEMHVAAPVDCTKENPGMDKLRSLIKDVIDGYKVKGKPVMGQMKPASYVKLSDMLSEEVKNTLESFPVITHSNLSRIVQNSALDLDETKLQQAVRFLHESGVLLHYEDSTLHLRDLYFIDPGWLCRMMAQVVTVPQINPFIKNGILKKKDVRLLFTGKKLEEDFIFPKSLIPQYLKLLEKFEIALPYSEEELLIPSRLPDRIPDYQMPNLRKDEKICRYYKMPHVPLGLWSRLITRMIVFSKSVVTETLMELPPSCIPRMTYWRKGIYVYWTDNSFVLLDSCISDKEEIHITVPASKGGFLLLGQVVDHLDALIDEWYPGLTSVDPLQGRQLLEKYAPCVYCEESEQPPFLFLLEDLLKQTEESMEIECPQHGGHVPLSLLAPDVVLSDLDSSLQLDLSQFDLVESSGNLLGDGGYGAVYKAKYKDQTVAVKMFNAIGDIHPHVMLRQEATVLRCLKHPSVVSLLAVGVQPRVIVLELAQKGSLSKVLRSKEDLSRIVQHRIAAQVAEGLVYLHKLMIVYRDLKPDNVLIFSTVTNFMINAKISDYGIARFSTLDGLVAQEGTPAYRAPEVIRGETYSFKADVFSYGITIYSLLTGGKHPFFEYEFNSEMDRAIADGTKFPTITQRGCPPWSDMQNIITRCLDQLPDKRPDSKEIFDQLMRTETLSLRQWVPVSSETTVECMTYQVQDKENGGKQLNLWIGSGDSDYVQLSHFNLMDPTMESKGAMFRYGRILCLQPIGQGFLLIGTQMCKIWVYDTIRHEFRHCTRLLPDAVICMKFISGHSTDDLIIVGLANGLIAVYPVSEILYEPNCTPMLLSPGKQHESIRCMEVKKRRVFASCGPKVVIISTRTSIFIEKTFDTSQNKNKRSSPSIYTMAVGTNRVYISLKGTAILQVWDVIDVKKHKTKRNEIQEKLRDSLDIAALFKLPPVDGRVTSMVLQNDVLWIGTGLPPVDGRVTSMVLQNDLLWIGTGCGSVALLNLLDILAGLPPVDGRVTSMVLQNDVLWIGTGCGSVALLDLNTKQPITITHRYTSAVRSLMYINCQDPSYKAVLSGGIGFKDRPGAVMNKEDECGVVAVWEADFAEQSKKLKDYEKSRKTLINNYV